MDLSLYVSIASAVAAGVAAYYARGQVSALGRARRDQNEPHVVVDLRPRHPGSILIAMFVTNIGTTTAHNVRIEVDQPLRSTLGADWEKRLAGAVAREISTLPPGRELMWNMDRGFSLEASDLPRQYTFTVHATGPFGPMDPVQYVVNLEVLLNTSLNSDSVEALLSTTATNISGLTSAIAGASATVGSVFRTEPTVAPNRRVARMRKRARRHRGL